MQNDKFNEILSKRAKDFVVNPNADAFDKVLAQRKKQNNKRKRFIWLAAVACFLIALLVGIMQNKKVINYQIAETKTVVIEPNNSAPIEAKKEIFSKKNSESKKLNSLPLKSESPIILNKQSNYLQSPKTNSTNKLIYKKNTENVEEKNNDIKTDFKKNILIKNNPVLVEKNEIKLVEENKILVTKTDSNDETVLAKQIKKDSIISNENIVENNVDLLPKTVTKKPKKVGFQLALFNNYMLVNKAYNGADNETIKNNFGINYNEQSNQSYSLGMMVGLVVNRFIFSTGIAYNNVQFDKIYQIQKSTLTTNVKEKFVNDAGYTINVIDQSLSFVEIPVSLGYKIGTKKINFIGEIGTAIQFLNETKTYTLQSDSLGLVAPTTNEFLSDRFEKIQFLFFSSLQVQYNLNKHFLIFAGPTMRLHTNQYFKKEFTERPSSQFFGITSGIKINF